MATLIPMLLLALVRMATLALMLPLAPVPIQAAAQRRGQAPSPQAAVSPLPAPAWAPSIRKGGSAFSGASVAASLPFTSHASGRRLRYYRPTITEEINRFGNLDLVLRSWGVSSRTHQWTNEVKHGALLFQNLVQAVARDLLMGACLRLEQAELPVILHVHDEVIVEVQLSRGLVPRDIHHIMTERPPWAADLPIDAECWVSPRYGKVNKEKIKSREQAAHAK